MTARGDDRFQSTHPSGVRLNTGIISSISLRISIHAPQWGATHPSHAIRPFRDNFNPRTPVGCDYIAVRLKQLTELFQSTHPSGVRQITLDEAFSLSEISIHAPQWGATHAVRRTRPETLISIHAPQWGATGETVRGHLLRLNFNPRTPVGCDEPTNGLRTHRQSDFNPRTPVGCDPRERGR